VSTGPANASAGQQYDQTATAPVAGNNDTLFPADEYANCPSQLMGLSNDWTSMNTLVSNMFPNGNTNQGIGLVWGWMSLVGTSPLTAPAQDPNYTYQQVIILLTDGLNTQNRFSSTQSKIDARMEDTTKNNVGTCKNIKDAGITLYTVQVNTGGDPTSQMLKDCASSSDKFFMLTSANEIVTTFNQIGTNLSKLRLAK
jgi:von Willebrand factor type A domain